MNLSQQLKSLADKVVYAESTMSEYYNIGSIKVRVSDHMSNEMDCDLAIFGSKDAKGKHYVYTVIPMVGTFKEVQWFTNTNAVVEFIVRFESIARLLIKPPTHNTNQKERADYNMANKISEIATQEESICENKIDFKLWKTKVGALYKEKNGALKDILNEIYYYSGNDETAQNINKTIVSLPHAQKKICLDSLLTNIKLHNNYGRTT